MCVCDVELLTRNVHVIQSYLPSRLRYRTTCWHQTELECAHLCGNALDDCASYYTMLFLIYSVWTILIKKYDMDETLHYQYDCEPHTKKLNPTGNISGLTSTPIV